MMLKKDLLGEILGTFLLVFVGCGSVAIAVLSPYLNELWQVATTWGIGLFIALSITGKWSKAHFNPSVSFAQYTKGNISIKECFLFTVAQFLGASLAASTLLILSKPHLHLNFQVEHAMVFGEYFPNPGFVNIDVSSTEAVLFEGLGTFLLSFLIFIISDKIEKQYLKFASISLVLSLLIFFIAPYTQAGFNPARDFGPRLVSSLHFGNEVFTFQGIQSITVYVVAPLLGGYLSAKAHTGLLRLRKTNS